MEAEGDSSRVSISAGVIQFESREGSFTLNVDDILLVGELSSESWTFSDDYSIQLFTGVESVFDVVYSATGFCELIAGLGERLGHPPQGRLFNSTTWASRVLWPATLEGRPVYTFTPVLGTTMLERAWHRLVGGPFLNRQELAPEIREFLVEAAKA